MISRLLVIFLVLLCHALVLAQRNLVVELSTLQRSFEASEPILVLVELTGDMKEEEVPTQNPFQSQFRVFRNGQESVKYLGRLGKLLPSHDFLVEKSARVWIDLSLLYDFSLDGDYTVHFPVANTETEISFYAFGRPPTPVFPPSRAARGTGCSSLRLEAISQALSAAQTLAMNSAQYLKKRKRSTPRFKSWFGKYSRSKKSRLHSNFQVIANALYDETLDFDCTCTRYNVFAYVYPVQVHTKVVFFCNLFWEASLLGTDSKAGVLIHEISHFNDLVDTDDIVYGQTGCRTLAKNNPKLAMTNADSYEYFAENTPFQA